MSEATQRNHHRQQRARRVRAKIVGHTDRPRVTVFRSNRFIWLQVVDDATGKTLAAVTDRDIRAGKKAGTKLASATAAGAQLAEALKKQSITAVVFDRGEYRYHGRVAAVAAALREGGIQV